jgi:pyridoxine 5-phosphate synthase
LLKKLGVNIDHVATLRQARRGFEPDPVEAAGICENAGADSIVAHIREDRRHINETDIRGIKKILKGRFNVEMSLDPGIARFVLGVSPDQVTIVPERRQELTTEGGLDVCKNRPRIKELLKSMRQKNIEVSLFIDPVKKQIDGALALDVGVIEIHTGRYAGAKTKTAEDRELQKIREMSAYAHSRGLTVNVGHGLKYHNTRVLAQIPEIFEFNIGHSIISRAVTVGLGIAVREMLTVIGQR